MIENLPTAIEDPSEVSNMRIVEEGEDPTGEGKLEGGRFTPEAREALETIIGIPIERFEEGRDQVIQTILEWIVAQYDHSPADDELMGRLLEYLNRYMVGPDGGPITMETIDDVIERRRRNDDRATIVSEGEEVEDEDELEGSGAEPLSAFKKQLKREGIAPKKYLKVVREIANDEGYDGRAIEFSDDPEKKLMIYDDKGNKRHFGQVGYNDFILWSNREARGLVRAGYAEKKRLVFQKSHSKMRGDWKADKFSPNNLALRILW